jgi:hypothetical protein
MCTYNKNKWIYFVILIRRWVQFFRCTCGANFWTNPSKLRRNCRSGLCTTPLPSPRPGWCTGLSRSGTQTLFCSNAKIQMHIMYTQSDEIWANFRPLGGCLLWAVFLSTEVTSPKFFITVSHGTAYICMYYLWQKWVGLHFGQFIHSPAWSLW